MIQHHKREMSISHNEFYRLLPIALKNNDYEVDNDIIDFSYANGSIQINLGIEHERRIGALVLPVLHIVFSFTNVAAEDIDEFLSDFDKTYQRGGG